jgi:hypothetical protein
VNPRPLAQVLAGFGESGQAGWARWRRKTLPDDGLPESFAVLLDEVFTLVDPLLAGGGGGAHQEDGQKAAHEPRSCVLHGIYPFGMGP